ncbi:MAG: ArsA family ATPase [Solirubrobacterales bacterium]
MSPDRRHPGLLDRELVVVTGKGGCGKSTVAATLAVAAAARGIEVIVAEVDARADVARALGATGRPEPSVEVELAPRLHHVSIDPDSALRHYLADQLPSRALADTLLSSRVFPYFVAATPGMRELLTIGAVWDLTQEESRRTGERLYDLVILDAPATGHGLAMLEAPSTFERAAQAGRIAGQAGQIDALVRDPSRTAVVAAARPEELPVNETIDLADELAERLSVTLAAAVVDRVHGDPLTPEESRRVAAAGVDPAATGAALAVHRRAEAEHDEIDRLRRSLDCPVVTLPEIPSVDLGPEEIARLAGPLEELL